MSIVSDSEPQPGESVLPSRMIRVEKPQHPKSSPKHYKSRLCVQDLKCIYQHSQDQTYSPTPTQEAGRLLTWYAATHRERIWSMDCVQAYLNTPAPSRKGQRIFVRFPKGHERPMLDVASPIPLWATESGPDVAQIPHHGAKGRRLPPTHYRTLHSRTPRSR